MAQASRDENRIPTLLGVSNVDGITPIPVYADPITHRLLIDSAGGGTVTDVSVITANGFAGTVATSTTTPAITLSTTITGILQGNGTAISAASTTGTGAVVLANTPTLITPVIGAATGTSLSVTGLLQSATGLVLEETGGGTDTITLQAPASIAASYALTLPVDDGTSGQLLTTDGSGVLSWTTTGAGDVVGPASATDNAIARFDGTTGKLIQNSALIIDDTTGNLTGPAAGFTITGGTGTTAGLTLQTTSGVGASGADMHFKVGNNGATEAMTVLNSGFVGIGTTNPAQNFVVSNAGATGLEVAIASNVTVQAYNRTGGIYTGLTFDGLTNGFRTAGTSGNLTHFGAATGSALAGATVGQALDYSTSFTNAASDFTGINLTTAAVTAANTNTLRGITIAPGAITNAAGATTYVGADIVMPAITQSAGTLTSTGLKITGGTVTSGTSYALTTDTTAGNVGIGIATPDSPLHIAGDASSTAPTVSLHLGATAISYPGNGQGAYLAANAPTSFNGVFLQFQKNGSNQLSVASNGLIFTSTGIVNASSSSNASIQVPTTGTTITRDIADANPALIVQQVNASSTGDVLQVKNSSSTLLTVQKGGNVGIGTNSPDALLHNEVSDAGTNAVVFGQRHSHITSGTATTGFGIGEEYELENASGTNRVVGTSSYAFTDATNASEDALWTLQLMRAGTLATALAVNSLGALTADGVAVPTISSTNTLTNKRITRRTATTNAPGATPTTNSDNVDIQIFTGLATAITSMTTNLSGTPASGDFLEFWLTDNGTARAITWGASFAATTVALPTTTVISTKLRVLFEWGGSTWDCVAVA